MRNILGAAALALALAWTGAAAVEQTIAIGAQQSGAPLGVESLVAYDVALTGFPDYEHDVDVVFMEDGKELEPPQDVSMAGIDGAPTDKTLTLRVGPNAKAGEYAFALRVNGVLSAPEGWLAVGEAIAEEALWARDEAADVEAEVRYAFGGRFRTGDKLTLEALTNKDGSLALTLSVLNEEGVPFALLDRLSVQVTLPEGWETATATLLLPDGQQKSLHTAGGEGHISFALQENGMVRLRRQQGRDN